MKRLVVLVGVAAAVYGAKKLLTNKAEQTSQPYDSAGYGVDYAAPQAQG